ncbi:MAG: hypothetical protein FWC32_12095 [Firmicutes bacterium]|nr:hypothetical protein [Bacillota bacterium]
MRKIKLLAAGLAALFLPGVLFAPAVHASNTQQVILTVEQNIVSNHLYTPPATTFTYLLTPKNGNDFPMPYGSSPEGYMFTITEAAEIQLEPIIFDTPGIFTYELRCITDARPGFTVDGTVYTIQIYVTDDLQVTTTVYINPGIKMPNISFTHIYNGIPGPFPPGEDLPEPEEEIAWHPPSTSEPDVIINENTPITTPPGKPDEPYAPEPPTEPGVPDNEPEPSIEPPVPAEPIAPDEPGLPSEPGPGTPGTSPKTGDFSNQLLWITLITVSVVLLIFIVLVDRRLKRRRGI